MVTAPVVWQENTIAKTSAQNRALAAMEV